MSEALPRVKNDLEELDNALRIAVDKVGADAAAGDAAGLEASVAALYAMFVSDTSPSTGVPNVFRHIDKYIDALAAAYQRLPHTRLGSMLLRTLLVFRIDRPGVLDTFGPVFARCAEDAFAVWQIEFARNATNMYAQYYGLTYVEDAESADDPAGDPVGGAVGGGARTPDHAQAYATLLFALRRLFDANLEPEALDCLSEARLLAHADTVARFLTKENVRRCAEYVYQLALVGDPARKTGILEALARVYMHVSQPANAFTIALGLSNFALARQILTASASTDTLRQLSYIIAYTGACPFFDRADFRAALLLNPMYAAADAPAGAGAGAEADEDLERKVAEFYETASNTRLCRHVAQLVDAADMGVPPSVAEVLRKDSIDIKWSSIDASGASVLGDFFLNAFANAGCGTDRMLGSHRVYAHASKNRAVDADFTVASVSVARTPDPESRASLGSGPGVAPEKSSLATVARPDTVPEETTGSTVQDPGPEQSTQIPSATTTATNTTEGQVTVGPPDAQAQAQGSGASAGASAGAGTGGPEKEEPKRKTLYPEGSVLLNSSRGVGDLLKAIGAASVGVIHLWGAHPRGRAFDTIARYSSSPHPWVRLGALFAYGIASAGVNDTTGLDPVLRLNSFVINPYYVPPSSRYSFDDVFRPSCMRTMKETNTSVIASPVPAQDVDAILAKASAAKTHLILTNDVAESGGGGGSHVAAPATDSEFLSVGQAFAALSIGIAYAGTGNKLAADVLTQRLRLSSTHVQKRIDILEKNPRASCSLALGLVMAGSCDLPTAYFILRVIAGNSRTQRTLRFFPLKCIALGLVFLRASTTPEGRRRFAEFTRNLYDRLTEIKIPDSSSETTKIPNKEEQIHLAAYIQSIVTCCAYAFTGDARVISELMRALSDAVSGRIAAEESVSIKKYDLKDSAKDTPSGAGGAGGSGSGGGGGDHRTNYKVAEFTAQSGIPVQLPDTNFSIWPGENLDPISVLTFGLGLVAGDDEICRQMVRRYIERIIQFTSIQARRSCSLALAMTCISNPSSEVTDILFKIAANSDETISFNSTIALGITGAGTKNERIAQSIRQLIEMKYYSKTSPDEFESCLLSSKIALGLVNCGRGLVSLNVSSLQGRVVNVARLSCLTSLLMFMNPSSRVMLRPKCSTFFFLLAGAMRPKLLAAVDAADKPQAVSMKVGTYIDTVGLSEPYRLTGFQTHVTPLSLNVKERADMDDNSGFTAFTGILEDVVVIAKDCESEAPLSARRDIVQELD